MKDVAELENITSVAPLVDSYSAPLAWYALLVSELQILAAGIDLAIVSLLVHPLETVFRINDVGFAAITTVPAAIGVSAMYYPGGVLTDTFRRRDVIAAGCTIWAIAALVAARADSAAVLFLARLLAGIGTGVTGPAMFSMISDAFPRTRRALAAGAYWAGISIGGGVGLTICGALVEMTERNGMIHIGGLVVSPWQQCFVAIGAMGIIVLALVLTVHEPPRRERVTFTNSTVKSSLRIFTQYTRRNGLLWVLLFVGGAISYTGYSGIAAWGPAFGMRHYGITGVSSIALLGTFIAGGSLLGSLTGGLLAQRGINRGDPHILPRMFVIFSLICCVFSSCFPYMPSWLLAGIGIGVVFAMGSAIAALMMVGIQEAAPNEVRGQLYGVWGFMANAPSIVVAPLVAFLASGILDKAGGLGPALAVSGGTMSAIAVVLFAFSGAPYERARHEMRALAASLQPKRTYIHD